MTEIAVTDKPEQTLLIVDDTPANLGVITSYLEDHGFYVVIAEDGESGIKRALRVRPDLILLDVMMPGIDGFETCRRLKALPETQDVPVIFMTALADTDSKLVGFEVGGVDYVTKPIQIAEVLARVNTHLSLRAMQKQLAARNQTLQDELEIRRLAEAALAASNEQLSKALAALQMAQEELIRSAKLAGLGAMVAGVAHELNTPIGNAMLSSSTLTEEARRVLQQLSSGMLKRSALEQFLNILAEGHELLSRNLIRAGDLVQHFKTLAVDQTSDWRREFDLRASAGDVIATFLPKLNTTSLHIELDIPDGIEMDSFPGAFDQVLSNLLANAVLHAFENKAHGTIRVGGELLGNERVRLLIRDDGNGIPANRLGKIFDPFFTTKMGSGGSGIGLYIVYNLVSQVLGGTIVVESVFGQGTRFLIELPRVAPEPLSASASAPPV